MKKISPKILALLCVVSSGLTGQLSAMQKNQKFLWKTALDAAREAGKTGIVEYLENIK